MAEMIPSKRLLCRFFEKGYCRSGSGCPYSHSVENALKIPDDVCHFYLQNACIYMTNCRCRHIELSDLVSMLDIKETASKPRITIPASSPSMPPKSSRRFTATPSPTSSHKPSPTSSSHSSCQLVSYCDTNIKDANTRQCSEDSGLGSDSSDSKVKPNKSYAAVCKPEEENLSIEDITARKKTALCPYAMVDECPYDKHCVYIHGHVCDLCQRRCLHPYNEEQRKKHRDECINEHEREMELSFAVQRSCNKACGICMDIVMEKEPSGERRFGILEKCSHIFCLNCIRKWRATKQFDNRTIRSCPECRVSSDFVIPSKYWVDCNDDKAQLIEKYKTALSLKPCKYFNQGQGQCPFQGACFYLHAYPDGSKAVMQQPRNRRRQNQNGDVESMRELFLWNFLEVRDDRRLLLALELDDMMDGTLNEFLSDTDSDTDSSEDYGQRSFVR